MHIRIFILAIVAIFAVEDRGCAATPQRVLVVVSGHGLDEGKTRPGFEMDELAQAYAIFADNGLAIDIASPVGGKVVADRFDPKKPYNQRFTSDPAAAGKLAATRTLAAARSEQYAAIFIIGGKGAMFDLPVDADLKAILAKIHAAGGVIGAVCHGPAALINVPLDGGGSLAKGRRMTGFSNDEEVLFGKNWAVRFPVLLEDGLRGAGARFSSAPMMLNHVVVDGKLVTGQNPFSTPQTAEAVVRALGRTPVARKAWADETSIALVGRILDGEGAAVRTMLGGDRSGIDVPLIAMWGFHRAKAVGADRAALAKAVEVMEIAQPHFAEPQLVAAIAESRSKLVASK